jgi:hypothetical protein
VETVFCWFLFLSMALREAAGVGDLEALHDRIARGDMSVEEMGRDGRRSCAPAKRAITSVRKL